MSRSVAAMLRLPLAVDASASLPDLDAATSRLFCEELASSLNSLLIIGAVGHMNVDDALTASTKLSLGGAVVGSSTVRPCR